MNREVQEPHPEPVAKTPSAPDGRIDVRVACNPFDRFAPHGGRHARAFSFRVVTPDEVFHWDFLIPTLVLLLTRGGFDYDEAEIPGPGNWPLFLCSCGNVACGGFGSQSGRMTADAVVLAVEFGGRKIAFEFDRLRFEFWTLRMLRRMRGSARLRRDPWGTLVDRHVFDDALETLFATRPRCRAIWRRLKSTRNPGAPDFAELASIPPDDAADGSEPENYALYFGASPGPDLRKSGSFWEERRRVARRMEEETMETLPCRLYATLVGRNWEPVTLLNGQTIAFFRGAGTDASGRPRPSMRAVDAVTGKTVGFLKRTDAVTLAAMMDRHGLIPENYTEEIGRTHRTLPVRIGFSFRDPADRRLDWGASLAPKERFYFEMLRAVALKPGVAPIAVVKGETETVGRLLSGVAGCPEIAFLSEWILSATRETEYRLTSEETSVRRAWCDTFRKALACEAAGDLIVEGAVSVLPLKALNADSSLPPGEVIGRARSWIRLVWGREEFARPRVSLPGFPRDATGFAAFRGRELLDVCLTGVPLAGSELFDNFALYDRPSDSPCFADAREAFSAVSDFLSALPVRERNADGSPLRYWLECGIHDGKCEIGDDGRLVALRIIRMAARCKWVD